MATKRWLGTLGSRGAGDTLKSSRGSRHMGLGLDGPEFKSQLLCCINFGFSSPS